MFNDFFDDNCGIASAATITVPMIVDKHVNPRRNHGGGDFDFICGRARTNGIGAGLQ
jgi:hypothetical protein